MWLLSPLLLLWLCFSLPLWQELLVGGFIKGENAVKILGVSIYCGVTKIRAKVGDVLVFFIVVTESCDI